MRHKNPIKKIMGGSAELSLDPFRFSYNLGERQYQALYGLQNKVRKWLRNYDLSTHGYTFIGQRLYQTYLAHQFGDKAARAKVPVDYRECGGAILVTNGENCDLARILMTGYWDSKKLKKIAKIYAKNFNIQGKELNSKMKTLVQLLRREIDSMAHRSHCQISLEISPFKFEPRAAMSRRGGRWSARGHVPADYPAGSYKVFPIKFYMGDGDL